MTTITGQVENIVLNGEVIVLSTFRYVSGTRSTIEQSSHGFSVGDIITFKSGSFAKYTTGDTVVGIVIAVTDTDNFVLLSSGYTDSLSGLTINTVYFAQSDGSLGTTVTEVPIFIATSTTAGYLIVSQPIDHVNFLKVLSDITDGGTPSLDCLNYDQSKVFWSTAEGTPTLSISNLGDILDISIKKTIAGDTVITLSGTGLKFIDMDSKATPAATVDITLSDSTNFYFEISCKKSGTTDGGDNVILVQAK